MSKARKSMPMAERPTSIFVAAVQLTAITAAGLRIAIIGAARGITVTCCVVI